MADLERLLEIADAAEFAQHTFDEDAETARLGAAFGLDFENFSGVAFFSGEVRTATWTSNLAKALKLLALGEARQKRWGGV